jgi:hypothetical protein
MFGPVVAELVAPRTISFGTEMRKPAVFDFFPEQEL